jgi:hypothetical protein
VERDLIDGLEEFVRDLKSDAPIEKKYTCPVHFGCSLYNVGRADYNCTWR